MNGADLRDWLTAEKIDVENLAKVMGVSEPTAYRWLANIKLNKVTVLALAHLGCPQAKKEIENSPKRVGFGR